MRVHILGICGTFMGGIAALAKAAGHRVSGSDENVYPPMSDQLDALGIRVRQGYHPGHLEGDIDCVVVGNVMSRGREVVEALLNSSLPFQSGPQWLAEHVLRDRWVLAVAGTHGKTTTSSLLAWILDHAGLDPGFLIGGVPANFGVSARFGDSEYFVVEADEYDTAFFDKRAKFVHYRPRTLAITNIEFDHADIYDDLDAILRQFHHLLRTVPGRGLVAVNGADGNIGRLLEQGVWTPVESFSARDPGAAWYGRCDQDGLDSQDGRNSRDNRDRQDCRDSQDSQDGRDTPGSRHDPNDRAVSGSTFAVHRRGERVGDVCWPLLGRHNVENALAAICCAVHAGVPVETALEALAAFKGVRRRLEKRCDHGGITLYDDFAHHPTAIRATLAALRDAHPGGRIVAALEPGSNSMRMGAHREGLGAALDGADRVFVLARPDLAWDVDSELVALGPKLTTARSVDELHAGLMEELRQGDQVTVMSNRGFQGLPGRLEESLRQRVRDS